MNRLNNLKKYSLCIAISAQLTVLLISQKNHMKDSPKKTRKNLSIIFKKI